MKWKKLFKKMVPFIESEDISHLTEFLIRNRTFRQVSLFIHNVVTNYKNFIKHEFQNTKVKQIIDKSSKKKNEKKKKQ